MITPPKAVIFDYGDVQRRGLKGFQYKIAPLVSRSPGVVWQELLPSWHRAFFCGEMSEEDYWRRVVDEAGWELSTIFLMDEVRKNFVEIPGVREIVDAIRAEYPTAVLSVMPRTWFDHCDDLDHIRKRFPVCHVSGYTGTMKPEPEALMGPVRELNCAPADVLFYDDDPVNIEAASALGMNAERFFPDMPSAAQLMNSQVQGKYGMLRGQR